MLTVACVLKSAGIYDASWVARLRDGVARHLREPHRFVCLSDVDVPCERIPLEHDWPGWWSKIEVLQLEGPVLYFDLDTAIVGDLADIAATAKREAFTILRDFYRLGAGLGSGVMAWNDSDVSAVAFYDMFLISPDKWMQLLGRRGDQGFIEEVAFLPGLTRWQDAVPGQIVSYKVHCRSLVLAPHIPAGARVVCLHGKPKFADMPPTDPVRQAWEALEQPERSNGVANGAVMSA